MDWLWLRSCNWETFFPAMIATFLGVFLSFLLLRLYDRERGRRMAGNAKQAILKELEDNERLLEHLYNMLENSKKQNAVQYNIPHRLKTSAYDSALSNNLIRFIGTTKLQHELAFYAQQCQFVNKRMQIYEQFVNHNFAAVFRPQGHVPKYTERDWAKIQGEDVKREAVETKDQIKELINKLKS